MGEAGGERGIWGYVQGGMGGLADALEKACTDLRVDILRETSVNTILTRNGRACGVGLEGGGMIEAPIIASSVDAHLTFECFLSPDDLPEDFRQAISRIDYASASAKINLALSEPPQFSCAPGTSIQRHHHGTMHISPTLDFIERAYDDAKYGRPSTEPILEITLPSSVDSTVAPDGQHVMSMFVQYAPYELADGSWDDLKEPFADRCIELLSRYAPNVPDAILHRHVLSPARSRTHVWADGWQHHAGRDEPQSTLLLPTDRWLGRSSHAGGGALSVRRGQPPRWRCDGRLRQKCRRTDSSRRIAATRCQVLPHLMQV